MEYTMPSRSKSLLEEMTDDIAYISRQKPVWGLWIAGFFGITGAALYWGWPKLFMGLAPVIAILAFVLGVTSLVGSGLGYLTHKLEQKRLDAQRSLEDIS